MARCLTLSTEFCCSCRRHLSIRLFHRFNLLGDSHGQVCIGLVTRRPRRTRCACVHHLSLKSVSLARGKTKTNTAWSGQATHAVAVQLVMGADGAGGSLGSSVACDQTASLTGHVPAASPDATGPEIGARCEARHGDTGCIQAHPLNRSDRVCIVRLSLTSPRLL